MSFWSDIAIQSRMNHLYFLDEFRENSSSVNTHVGERGPEPDL